jgi:hypothetical protein
MTTVADDHAGARGVPSGLVRRFQPLTIATLAGFLSGFASLGVGCRLAMRAVALLAGDADQGRITDAQAVVGEITLDGSLFLAMLGGAVGTIGGLLYLAVRRRLAWAGPWRGLVFGGLLLAVFGSALIENRNPDFERFGIPIVNVAMFGGLFVLFGVCVAPVHDALRSVLLDQSSGRVGAIVRVAAFGAGAVLFLPVAAFLLATTVSIVDEDTVKRFLLALAFVYLVLALQLPSLAQRFRPATVGAGSRTILDSVVPLAPPFVVGLSLNVYELAGIL